MRTVLGTLAAFSFMLFSCQKKFDPKSYAPAESFGGYASSNAVEASSLVAHFSFENNLIDSVSNTAASNNGTTFTPGIKGQGLQIGLNNYAVFNPTSAIAACQSISIAFWVNTTEDTLGIQPFVSFVDSNQFWGNLDMFFDGQKADSATMHVHAYGHSINQSVFLQTWMLGNIWGAWKHFVLTFDAASNNFSFYVNGTLFGTIPQPGFGPLNFTEFTGIVIGTMQFQTAPSLTDNTGSQGWCSYVLGEMDELRIYNKALTAADVSALYNLENLGE
jgi:hypothetical protein